MLTTGNKSSALDLANQFPECDFESSISYFEFPKKISRNNSGAESTMGLWSLMELAVREKESTCRPLTTTKVNIVNLDQLESNDFSFDDLFALEDNEVDGNHSGSKQGENDRTSRDRSTTRVPATPIKHRRKVCRKQVTEAIDLVLKETSERLGEPKSPRHSRCAAIRRKTIMEGRQARMSKRTNGKENSVGSEEENCMDIFDEPSSGSFSELAFDFGISVSEGSSQRRLRHHRESKIGRMSHSSEKLPIKTCDLLGNPIDEKSRRHSNPAKDDRRPSKGKRRERKESDNRERDVVDEQLLSSSSHHNPSKKDPNSPRGNRRRSLNISVSDFASTEQQIQTEYLSQIDRLCDKLCQSMVTSTREPSPAKRLSGGSARTSGIDHSSTVLPSASDIAPKLPTRVLSPKGVKKSIRRGGSVSLVF